MPKKLIQEFERLLPSLKDLYTAVFPKKKKYRNKQNQDKVVNF